MVKGILADADSEGHFQVLLAVFRSDAWREIWDSLGLATPSFGDFGL
jgi:hypothetical protein